MSEDYFVGAMRPDIPPREMFAHPMRDEVGRYGVKVYHRGRVIYWFVEDRLKAVDVCTLSLDFYRFTHAEPRP